MKHSRSWGMSFCDLCDVSPHFFCFSYFLFIFGAEKTEGCHCHWRSKKPKTYVRNEINSSQVLEFSASSFARFPIRYDLTPATTSSLSTSMSHSYPRPLCLRVSSPWTRRTRANKKYGEAILLVISALACDFKKWCSASACDLAPYFPKTSNKDNARSKNTFSPTPRLQEFFAAALG